MKERLQLHRPLSLAVARAHALELADTHVDRTRQPPSSTTSHRPWQNREGRGQVGSAPAQQASQHVPTPIQTQGESENKRENLKKGSRNDKKGEAMELESPRSERPTRERKTVERFVVGESPRASATKTLSIEKGKGTQLKDIPTVAFKLPKRKTDETLQLLHTVLVGKKSKVHTLKKNIGLFSGFVWVENEEKQRTKVKEKLEKCVRGKLLDLCDVLNITVNKTSTKKEELTTVLVDFLESPHATIDSLLADKEKKGKKRKSRGSTSKGPSSSNATAGQSKKKQKLDSTAGKKSKPSMEEEQDSDDDKSKSSQLEDDHDDDSVVGEAESEQEEHHSDEGTDDDEDEPETYMGENPYQKLATIPRRPSLFSYRTNRKSHHQSIISCLAYNAAEKLIYTGSHDRTVKVWSVSERRCVESLTAHEGQVNAVVVNESDGCVFTCSSDGTVKIWRSVSRETPHILTMTLKFQPSPVNALALSRCGDDCFLYSGSSDGLINFWEKERISGRYNHAGFLQGHHFSVLCLVAVEELVLSGSEDATIRIWKRDEGNSFHSCVAVIDGHHGPVRCLAAAMESDEIVRGLLVYSASLDQTMKVWRVKVYPWEKGEDGENACKISPVLSPSWVERKIQATDY
ncbi:hypothetical protein SASPL_123193 [Salvia splendens]|uniref:Protein JINGUBANG n=1 Tax=Salvia splendens TaxID=180675 RepID=A0A8X8XKN1_SALSN|nr:hypothetical protein SASPL_123193 [Salvia splendens]